MRKLHPRSRFRETPAPGPRSAPLSIFTKIFIVLVMLLSVLLSALSTVFVVNTDTFKGKYLNEQRRREIAEANSSVKESDLSHSMQALQAKIDQGSDQIARLNAQIITKDSRAQDLQGQLIVEQNKNADVRGQLAQLSASLQQSQQLLATYDQEVKQRREDELKLQTRNVELSAALKEKQTSGDTLIRQVRLLKEQIADLDNQNQKLMEKVQQTPATAVASTGPAPQPGVVVRGQVTDVKKIGDETFLALNVGAHDGVREGMKFLIHQGDKYLGDAVIVRTDVNTAAARVVLQRGTISSNCEAMAGGL